MAVKELRYSDVERGRLEQRLKSLRKRVELVEGVGVAGKTFVLDDGTAAADGGFTLDDGAA